MSSENYFGRVIHSRTREDALADGDLVEVGDMAREARFRIPRTRWPASPVRRRTIGGPRGPRPRHGTDGTGSTCRST